MKRALILRPALNTFFNDVQSRWESESSSERIKPVALKYRLSPYDWKVVEILVKLLKPFEVATKQLQGTVYEEIEDPGTKERKRPPFSRGWTAKLGNHGRCSSNSGGKSYISITIFLPARFMWVQLSPILLRSGVFLICCGQESRPDVSMDYIERRLARSVAGSALFRSPSTTATSFRKGNNKTKQMAAGTAIDGEYARYCAEDVVNSPHYRCQPIDWWKINVGRYPRLSILAIDMLSIPSSSAESERISSSAGKMTGPLRNRLRREIVAMAQCIRSWSAAGIYSTSPPLLNLDDN
ncbi:hypothetical protein NHJ6243_009729, partial [Beauveria neobassiana]